MPKLTDKTPGDWGPFGRPLFEDPSARALSRVGVIDIGSNSVRLVVFDGAARSPAYFYNEKILCGLGIGLGTSGILNPDGRNRALESIRRFQLLAKQMNIPPLTAVATAAVREARDGAEFCREVLKQTGLKVWVIDGKEEARLSAQGVLLGWPEADGLVCDIGGSSMELAVVKDGHVGACVTSGLGPLTLQSIKGGKKGRKAHIRSVLKELAKEVGPDHKRLYLVGGSWRAIARADMARRNYPLSVQHEYRMRPQSIRATAAWIDENELTDLQNITGTSALRMALVPTACVVLKEVLRTFGPKEVAVSSYGIREGLLYEQMPERLRKRDPLIEACRFAESKDARMPGAGRILFDFIAPLFKTLNKDRMRLVQAACLLHDVTWRAHPDFRAEVCFDNATRANLGGLRHSERVWLGLALLHRYKSSRNGSRFEPTFELLSEKDIAQAETVGKAMRFGAMLGGNSPEGLAKLSFKPRKKEVRLSISGDMAGLFGEVARARFESLANALGATAIVRIEPASASRVKEKV